MKILLAIDGSACSEAAVEEVAVRTWPAASQVRIVSAVEAPSPLTSEPAALAVNYYAEVEKIERDRARETVERAARRLREAKAEGLEVTTEILAGSPRHVVVEEAERWGADLIVVGSHGYRSWERMLLGSVSQSVALHAECSVEIVRRRKG